MLLPLRIPRTGSASPPAGFSLASLFPTLVQIPWPFAWSPFSLAGYHLGRRTPSEGPTLTSYLEAASAGSHTMLQLCSQSTSTLPGGRDGGYRQGQAHRAFRYSGSACLSFNVWAASHLCSHFTYGDLQESLLIRCSDVRREVKSLNGWEQRTQEGRKGTQCPMLLGTAPHTQRDREAAGATQRQAQEGNKSPYFLPRLGFQPLACVVSVQSHQLSASVLGLFLVL